MTLVDSVTLRTRVSLVTLLWVYWITESGVSMTHVSLRVGAFAAVLVTGVSAQTELPPAIPRDPISVIVEAAKSHQIVAFLDAHGHEQLHQLNLALIRDRRFTEIVNDVVVEFGNALYQDVLIDSCEGKMSRMTPFDALGWIPRRHILYGTHHSPRNSSVLFER
jgi:hypothetical protein